MALLTGSLAGPAATAAGVVSITLDHSPAEPHYLEQMTVTATIEPAPEFAQVYLYDADGDGLHWLDVEDTTTGQAVFTFGAALLGVGEHGVYVEVGGVQSEIETVTIARAPSTVQISQSIVPEAFEHFTLFAVANSDYHEDGGTVEFYVDDAEDPICVDQIGSYGSPATCQVVDGLPAGTYTISAHFLGTTHLAPSIGTRVIDVTADPVSASLVGIEYGTFYPVKDGYRDKLPIKGHRGEPISVSIRIYSPEGALIKTASVASGTGWYTYRWDGRKADGSIRPAGEYKITQSLNDGESSVMYTSFAKLSKKKLVTSTKTITKSGPNFDAKGTDGGASVSKGSGYVKLNVPDPDFSWAGVGWEFTIPSAEVYTSIVVRVYGRHKGAAKETRLGAQDFSDCGTWNEGCFNAWEKIPSTSGTSLSWYKTDPLSDDFRSGRKVRLMVSSYYGQTWIHKAQVVVKYGFLQ